MKAFLLKYRSSLLLFAVMFLFGWGSAAVVAKWQSDRETEETMHIEAAVDNWGLGFGESGKELQPTGNATADELKQYDTYYIGSKEEKVIYLTFDCGYENGNTGAILDALKKHNAPGTFFVVGHFLESAPELVKRMVTEGHTVGNHTYHHPDMSAISDKESFQKELDAVSSLFQEVTGQEMTKYYRPPQGKYSTENLATEEEAYGKLIGRIHPGAIVLLHNTSSTNGKILDELLTRWEDMGYTFQPLSHLWSDEKTN